MEPIVASPIFVQLFKIAIPTVTAYYSDLGHDAITLSRAEPGTCFLWGYYHSGSHLMRLTNLSDVHEAMRLILRSEIQRDNWYLIVVTKQRGAGQADGEIIHVPSNETCYHWLSAKLQDRGIIK